MPSSALGAWPSGRNIIDPMKLTRSPRGTMTKRPAIKNEQNYEKKKPTD